MKKPTPLEERRPELCWGIEHPEYSSDQRVRQGPRRPSTLEEPTCLNPKLKLSRTCAREAGHKPRRAIRAKPCTRAGNFVARRYRVHPAFADLVANLAGLGSEASSHDLLLQIESRGH